MLRIAASLTLLLGLSMLLPLRYNPLHDEVTILHISAQTRTTTITAENVSQRHVVLPDGSEVWLRRDGTLIYASDFSAGRIIHLEGEAYFSVVHQEGRPFIVYSKDITVKVLGTEFCIKSEQGAIHKVSLVEGSIEVTIPGKTIKMQPCDNLLYNSRSNEMVLGQIELSKVAPWKDANLTFNNAPVKEVFRRLSEYFNVTFAIDDRLQFNQTLTVDIDENESLDDVLFIVWNTIRNFNYTRQENKVTVLI
jgi:ferric-dicitrate binding protein FerR (iron transport regulator)